MSLLYKRLPDRFIFDGLDEYQKKRFADFFTLCVLKGETKEDGLLALMEIELAKPEHMALMYRNWVRWDELKVLLAEHNLPYGRVTLWNYCKSGVIPQEYYRTGAGGASLVALFDADNIISTLTDLAKKTETNKAEEKERKVAA